MTTSLSSYKYFPLGRDDTIRVVEIAPSPDPDAPIECTLLLRRLSEDEPEYEALSYTWGDAADRMPITVTGASCASIIVTKNCFNALRNLRTPDKARTMWIDAICINQDDLSERSAQVRMMFDIFFRASRTMVYLGEETTESEIVFNELIEAAPLPRNFKALSGGHVVHRARPRPNSELALALDALLRRPWFQRVWVLQEVYASECPWVMCGPRAAPWDTFQDFTLGYTGTKITRDELPFSVFVYGPAYTSPWDRLFKLLANTQPNLATDPRDKVLALKAFLGQGRDQLDPFIDYSMSVEDLYQKVAEKLLQCLGSRVLSAIRHPHNRTMPSWVPDWSRHYPLRGLFPFYDSSDLCPSPVGWPQW